MWQFLSRLARALRPAPRPAGARAAPPGTAGAAELASLTARRAALRKELAEIQAKYDAAATTPENARHWAAADSLSARGANSPDVRRKLRERARYEFGSNGYCMGLVTTLANDLIGVGPKLQVLTEDRGVNAQVERAFAEWAEAVGLAEKLWTMKQAKVRDGEGFALLTTNGSLPVSVQLDLRLVEADQIATPEFDFKPPPGTASWVDGIEFNSAGVAVAYHLLKDHPGDALLGPLFHDYDRLPARSVLHWYRCDRPGQARGVPEITPALPLFATLRRYTLATLSAAETAANFAAILETEAPPDGAPESDSDFDRSFETMPVERGMLTALPAGWKMNQLEPQNPSTTYEMFKRELLKEIGRPCNAPFNVISGDSSPYNYSSARLDHLLYRAAVRVEREVCRRNVLERIFRSWLDEAVMIPGLLPEGLALAGLPHAWHWPGTETIDPIKERKADTEALSNGTTTYAALLAEGGLDWEDVMRQRAREKELLEELGLPPPPAPVHRTGGAAPAAQGQAVEGAAVPRNGQGRLRVD
jgi:lambda family phage portal protein